MSAFNRSHYFLPLSAVLAVLGAAVGLYQLSSPGETANAGFDNKASGAFFLLNDLCAAALLYKLHAIAREPSEHSVGLLGENQPVVQAAIIGWIFTAKALCDVAIFSASVNMLVSGFNTAIAIVSALWAGSDFAVTAKYAMVFEMFSAVETSAARRATSPLVPTPPTGPMSINP